MRKILMRLAVLPVVLLVSIHSLRGQSCVPTNINGTIINLLCNQVCSTLVFHIPHLKSTEDYVLSSIPYNPFPYNTPTGLQDPNLYNDDQYSFLINLPFTACFYGQTYPSCVVGSNGIMTFDPANASCANAWPITTTIPYAGGAPCQSATTYYPRVSIMGAYSDLDPRTVASPPDRKIQWEVIGTAPCRKFVVSYYHVGVFGNTCGMATPNTFQMVVYESTGIVEINIEQKACMSATNGGRAILGIQDWSQSQAIAAPGKNNTVWNENNTAYRYTPNGATSRYVISEMLDLSGNVVATADTLTTIPGMLDIRFLNFCPPAGTDTFIVRTKFSSCDNPLSTLVSMDSLFINHVNSLNATATTVNASCGAPDGQITVTVPAGVGTPPYTFVLDGVTTFTGASPHTFTGVAAGPHTVVVTDASGGCTSTINVTVNTSGVLTATVTTLPTSCFGVNNGSITITSATGTGPYTFKLDGGPAVPGTIPFTFSNVSAGAHTVQVIDGGTGCSSPVITVNVPAGPGVNATATSTATACAGVNNGTITVTANTGTPPFTWQLDALAPVGGASPYTFVNVSGGVHTVTVTDNLGCNNLVVVTVNTGPGVNGTLNSTPTSCPAANDGTITATATSGSAPFTWKLDAAAPVPGPNPYTFNNVAAGSHTVVITDNFGCTFSSNVTVNAGPPLAATANPTATSCNGASNGMITVTPTNGTSPYTYSLDGGPALPGGVPYTFMNVAAGVHIVVVTDAAGCVSNPISVTVDPGPVLNTTVVPTDVLCHGGATGVITVTPPAIGTPPFQYSLNGTVWQASNVFNGLTAGPYTVYYRESNGCQGQTNTTVNEPAAITSSATTVPATCNGRNDGTITINANGGVAPFSYSIDGGANWQASNIFTKSAGIYTVIIRDANGCTRNQSATITEPALLTASSITSNATCDGGNDGTITITANGGNLLYTYSIDGVNFQPSNVFNVGPGSYTVYVTDNLGCSVNFPATVNLTNNLTLTPQSDVTICESNSTQLQLNSNATQYVWTPATGLSSTTIPNPVASPTTTTQYIVTATLSRCNANDTVIVFVDPAPIPNAGPDAFICYGQTYQLQGSGGVQYTWSPSTYLSSTTISNPVSTPAKTITYTLQQVVDANGCKSLITDDITIDVTPPIKVSVSPYDTVVYAGDQVQLFSNSIATNYVWSPATGLNNPNIQNPIATIGPVGNDILYQVTASTAAGCKGEGYVKIKIYNGPDIYVAKAFTPNGDGLNDKLTPFPVGITELKFFRVYDRWGKLVFSTEKLRDGWDGKLNGVEQASGAYVWMVQGITKNGVIIYKQGTFVLIR